MSRTSARRQARRSTGQGLGPELEAARRGIEQWRETREKRTRMPEPLWEAAVAAAGEHGAWRVSRALGVNYQSLRSRVENSARAERGGARAVAGFVEIDGVLCSPEREAATLELSRPDGARLTIRLGGRDGLDVAALAAVFWRGGE